jgi:uncharacterized protein
MLRWTPEQRKKVFESGRQGVHLWEEGRKHYDPLAGDEEPSAERPVGGGKEATPHRPRGGRRARLPLPVQSGSSMPCRIQVDRDRIADFCRRWNVVELSLFGSALRDDFGPDSDVDVLVELGPHHGLSLVDWVTMIDELRVIFGRDVDLVAKAGLKNPFRRRSILENRYILHAA